MKKVKYIITIVFTLIPLLVVGQTQTENYVKQTTYTQGYGLSHIQSSGSVEDDHMIENVGYVDGLGRPIQNVIQRAGGDRQDLVTYIEYDNLGRKPKDFLPLPTQTNGGSFQTLSPATINGYYYGKFPDDGSGGTINAYSETVLEESPLARKLESGAPGDDWKVTNGHTIKYDYMTNSAGFSGVYSFSVSFSDAKKEEPYLVYDGSFITNDELYVKQIKDENWTISDGIYGITYEYVNKKGQVVLKRSSVYDAVKASTQDPNYHDTYYVYDRYGNLTYVIPPEGSKSIVVGGALNSTALDDFGYKYNYDVKNRLIEKRIPGKGWEYIVYNKLDQPILTQDKELRLGNQWLFTRYDAHGRVVYTGITGINDTRENLQSGADSHLYQYEQRSASNQVNADQIYYTDQAYPSIDNPTTQVFTINYYDSYIHYSTPVTNPTVVLGQNAASNTQGLPTVSKVRVLGTTKWITTLSAYDDLGRVIYVDSYNELFDSRDYTKSLLDFTGKVVESESFHGIPNNTSIVSKDYFHYDHAGRLLSHKQQIGNEPVQLIAENIYDDLGQLVRKNVGGQTFVDGYTDLSKVNVTYDGTITSDSNSWLWLAKAKTKGEIPANVEGGIKAKPSQTGKHIKFGLVKTGSFQGGNNQYYDYGIYLNTISGVHYIDLIIDGTVDNNSGNHYGTYTPDDPLSVERIANGNIVFKHNLQPIHTETSSSNNDGYVGKVSFGGPVGSVYDLSLFGPLIDKKLQEVDYKYNIRGWLTDINDVEYSGLSLYTDLFNFRINYNQIQGNSNGTPLYNGNIAQTLWKTANTDSQLRGYNYKYDDLNRITEAKGYKGSSLTNMSSYASHDLIDMEYDQNGNIMELKRYGEDGDDNNGIFGLWDELIYSYEGNKLKKVTDNSSHSLSNEGFIDGTNLGDDYSYDWNGNMIKDQNKGITTPITYNHLNLPTQIDVDLGNNDIGRIQYIYDATGVKLRKMYTPLVNGVTSAVVTDYVGNHVYQDDVLQFFNHPEGYVEVVAETSKSVKGFDDSIGQITNSEYHYVFQYKDHLGNIRLSYTDDDLDGSVSSSDIIEESNYYPFGLKHKGYNNVIDGGNDLAQKWNFLGQEKQDELDLNWLTFRYRNYMPDIGRFFGVDPISEEYMSISTYQFAHNSPVWKIEIEGLEGKPSNGLPDLMTDEPKSIVQRMKAKSPQYKTQGPVFSGSATVRGKWASIGMEASLNSTAKAKFSLSVAEGSATVTDKDGLTVKGKGKLLTGSTSIATPVGESTVSASLGEVNVSLNEEGLQSSASLVTATGSAKTKSGTTVSDGFTLLSSDDNKNMNTNGVSVRGEQGAFTGVLSGESVGVGIKAGPASVSVSMNPENAGNAVSNFFATLADVLLNGADNYKFKGVPNQD